MINQIGCKRVGYVCSCAGISHVCLQKNDCSSHVPVKLYMSTQSMILFYIDIYVLNDIRDMLDLFGFSEQCV